MECLVDGNIGAEDKHRSINTGNNEGHNGEMKNVEEILHSVRELRQSCKLISGVIATYDSIKYFKNYLRNHTDIKKIAVIGFNSGSGFSP